MENKKLEDTKYYKAVRYGLKSKPKFILSNEKVDTTNVQTDLYDSLYLYKQEHLERFKENKTVSGITDTVTNRLFFDFDNKSDIEVARKDTVELINRLESNDITPKNYRIMFSGNKGFNVEVGLDFLITPTEFKTITSNLTEGLSSFDSVVSDPNRIVRVLGTKNQNSGLYKIALTKSELENSTIDSIKELAKVPRQGLTEKEPIKRSESIDKLAKPKLNIIERHKLITETDYKIPENTSGMDNVRWHLQCGIFGEGERHNALLALAAYYRSTKTKKQCYYALKCAADDQAERYGCKKFNKDEIWVIVDSVYSPNWKGGIFSYKDTNSWLYEYKNKYNIKVKETNSPQVLSQFGGDSFVTYAKSFRDNRIYSGLPILDKVFPITAGSNIGIVGYASSGKTALLLKILENLKEQGSIAVFASLDMSKSRIFQKILMNVTEGKFTQEEIFEEYIKGNGAKYDAMVKDKFPNVYVFAKSGPTIDELRDYILSVEELTGKHVSLLAIDYFEKLVSERTDETSASKDIANGIQDLVHDFPRMASITLYQPNKMQMSSGPDKPITNYAAIKGSSFIISSARQLLSIWRPFFRPDLKQYDKFIEFGILKNDLGELDQFKFNWVGKTGSITEMQESDKIKYDEYMKNKEDIDNGYNDDDEKNYKRKSKWDL